ncbi:MAG TPA: S1 RNA-binding domain-containing protein [Actinomycetota bacterium]|nr:S1 RNA-binding domain-containing protein [Actinomycetota bacterium]
MPVEVGQIVEGTVTRLAPYGAFITLETGETGLVHISEVDRNFVREITEFLHETDKVTVKVVGIKDGGKIDLSIKQASPDWSPEPRSRRDRDPEFEQKLKKFMKQSEENLVDWRRQRESKRG